MKNWKIQSLRYVIVGLASNLILYIHYLVFTTVGIGHKTAMTLLYFIGMFQTFIFNKRWTFLHHGSFNTSLVRYIIAYIAFYLLNLGVLHLFVDLFSYSHALVQGTFMVIIVGPLFLVQKYWIFPQVGTSSFSLSKVV